MELRIKNRKIKRSGNSFQIIIPTAFVRDSDFLDEDKEYDVVFVEKNGICAFPTPDLPTHLNSHKHLEVAGWASF